MSYPDNQVIVSCSDLSSAMLALGPSNHLLWSSVCFQSSIGMDRFELGGLADALLISSCLLRHSSTWIEPWWGGDSQSSRASAGVSLKHVQIHRWRISVVRARDAVHMVVAVLQCSRPPPVLTPSLAGGRRAVPLGARAYARPSRVGLAASGLHPGGKPPARGGSDGVPERPARGRLARQPVGGAGGVLLQPCALQRGAAGVRAGHAAGRVAPQAVLGHPVGSSARHPRGARGGALQEAVWCEVALHSHTARLLWWLHGRARVLKMWLSATMWGTVIVDQ